MSLTVAPYTLRSIEGREREGLLLRLQTEGGVGYADCHPWNHLGDKTVEEQRRALAAGQLTPLLEQSLRCARHMATLQRRFFDFLSVKSHSLNHLQNGFDTIKIKGMPTQFPAGIRVRLDLQERPSQADFEAYLAELGPERFRLDFVEDPFPYACAAWESVQQKWGVPLASDRLLAPKAAVWVVKPAMQQLPQPLKRLVVTSYCDHPIGQLWAMRHASFFPHETHGVATHLNDQPTPFHPLIHCEGGRVRPAEGCWERLQQLCEELKWEAP